jgi:AcrR family transcriptional regulator
MPRIFAPTVAQHRTETNERLLDAFGELLMKKGYDGVSLADVAGAVGLARTAIYNYFPDRETLLVAWTDREVARTIEALLREVEAAESSTEKLRTFVRLQLESFATRHLPPGQEVAQLLGREVYQRFMSHIAPLEDVLREILKEGVDVGEFTAYVEQTVPMILACIGAERVPIATGAHEVDEATQRVSEFLLRALGATESGTPKKATRRGL